MYVCKQKSLVCGRSRSPEEGSRVRVTGGSEPTNVGAGNRTVVLQKIASALNRWAI